MVRRVLEATTLLGPDDPSPFTLIGDGAPSPFVLIADHAGQVVPAALDQLGLPQVELDRHIGWDIGIAGTTRKLAALLEATAVLQTYSRLVIDCNRPLSAPGSIPAISDGTDIAANVAAGEAQRTQRAEEIFAPYHAAIRDQLDARAARGQPTILIAMHSFTPVFGGIIRPWHAGVLYLRDNRLAMALKPLLEADGLVVGDNQPYAVSDQTDYAIPVHGEARGLVHLELEIRQDLIADDAGQAQWAQRLANMLTSLAPGFTHA
ncbi:Predicted N-formylglutamate amidohydrolase [Pseudoxanthomonas sp. GM95]|uniref:N-formylglutamate amidohydrolase n=1 Tax=Pseudoxanthomonas sp. GM95 TaxID=1881043 RepID=UPI0008C97E29|nr:N-formylglutamate amidohydrolase [Pseudoxanthomonas sp. GM95]SEK59442.1 Predicted N-formylglutamate amidohydrolase [Pseudoxanthomonas sp. GM95]